MPLLLILLSISMKFYNLYTINLLIVLFFMTFFSHATSFYDGLSETKNLVKAGDKQIILLGDQVSVGDKAPNFKVVNESFTEVTLEQFKDKIILISAVPSLDTGVCSLQTKRFNEEATNLDSEIVVLTISNDLPFAQRRFCKNENIDKIVVLSDTVWHDFGAKYGLLIKDMGLLSRAIFIVDPQGQIAYKEIVPNISNHPNYEMALATLTALSPATVSKSNSK